MRMRLLGFECGAASGRVEPCDRDGRRKAHGTVRQDAGR
jgi:hypothetical protein